jgi:hypothetical protein
MFEKDDQREPERASLATKSPLNVKCLFADDCQCWQGKCGLLSNVSRIFELSSTLPFPHSTSFKVTLLKLPLGTVGVSGGLLRACRLGGYAYD